MHWILQNNIFNEEAYDTLVQTLQRFNIPYSVHKVIPFVGDLLPEPDLTTNNAICMGSYSMRHWARKAGVTPGVFDLEPFNFEVQLAHWGDVVSTTQEDFGDVVVKTYETAPSIWSASHSSEPARCSDHYSYTSHSSSSCSSYGDSGGSSSCSSGGCD